MKIGFKKGILNMSKAEMISQSVVFVDKNSKIITDIKIGNQQQNVNIENKFVQLTNILLLKQIIGKDGFQSPSSNPIQQDFIFNDIVISNTIFPPKFTIKHNTSDKKSVKAVDIAKKIIEIGNLSDVVEGIGLNYEFYYNNETNQINLKQNICNTNISSDFESIHVRLSKDIKSTKLVLTLSDAVIDGKKVIYILANFHNDISTTNTIDMILKENYLPALEKIIENIFEKNGK